jgi:hypothetical protein
LHCADHNAHIDAGRDEYCCAIADIKRYTCANSDRNCHCDNCVDFDADRCASANRNTYTEVHDRSNPDRVANSIGRSDNRSNGCAATFDQSAAIIDQCDVGSAAGWRIVRQISVQ